MHNRHRSPGNGYRSSASSAFAVAPPPPPPPPPPRRANSFQRPLKADIFAEAGRLAAEYLVSQGLLPPTVLSSSSTTASAAAAFKRSLRPPPPDSVDNPPAAEGRTSALSRLGNPALRRRFNVDDFRSKGPTRRRPYRGYGGSDWGRDYPRTPSFHDRFPRDSPDFDHDADADADGDVDSNSHSEPPPPAPPLPRENLPSKNEEETALEAAPAPAPDSDLDDDDDLKFKQNDNNNLTVEDEKQNSSNASSSSSKMMVVDKDDNDSSNNTPTPDLRTICKFEKVPTRIRSSKTSKSTASKLVDPIPIPASEEDKDEMLVSEDPSSGRMLAADTVGGAVGDLYDLERDNCESSSRQERGEKRGLEEGDNDNGNRQEERAKWARDWPPSSSVSVVMEAGHCFNISNLTEKQVGSHEDTVVDNSHFSKHGDGAEEHNSVDFLQEKHLFPGSFKICDLNLMEVSDAHESRDGNPIMIYPAMKTEDSPIDVDLSISNSANPAGETSRGQRDSKEIEVIDLENDSAQEEEDMVIEDRKTETVFTDLEGFPNHAQNTGDIPDVQDGYGLMFSEFLGNDFPNCSSVPENLNPLHNDIGLHNGEGALADDDSIYMSLGEIPLTYLRPWEQPPPQEYEKPF